MRKEVSEQNINFTVEFSDIFQLKADADHGITIIQSNEVVSTVEERQAWTAVLQTYLRTNLLVSVVLEWGQMSSVFTGLKNEYMQQQQKKRKKSVSSCYVK